MTALDLLDLRSSISPGARQSALQSLDDLRKVEQLANHEVKALEGALADVRSAEDDPVVRVLCGLDLVQSLSKARSGWCRACTAVERAVIEVDRIDALRAVYSVEVDDALRR